MFCKTKKRIMSSAVSAAVVASALMSPLGVSGVKNEIPTSVTGNAITASAAAAFTVDDMPSEYTEAMEWIWTNRFVREGSTSRRNTIFDQIVAGNGTINYVVRWQSYQTVSLEQRQQFETLVSNCINAWNDCLVGYENWPYDHIDVNIVGWAVIDESCILNKQDDEIVYTDVSDYVIQSGESSEIPTLLPNAPSELSRFDHFEDTSYEYPGGLDKRFDMYLWATQNYGDWGGCGGDWGQRLSDNAYFNMLSGVGVHILEHEIGHGFGITDFYGDNGELDGPPPSGFPDDGTSIMMAGSSSVITNFDEWMLRYIWTQIKDEEGRFDIEETPVTTTTTTTITTTTQPVVTTTTTKGEEQITYPSEIFSVKDAVSADITLSGTAYAGINGAVGYWVDDSWYDIPYEGTLDKDGRYTFNFEVPSGVDEIQVQIYWSGIWDNDKGETVDVPADIAEVKLNNSSVTTAVTTAVSTSTTTVTAASGTAEAEISETEYYWAFHANGAKRAELIFNAVPGAGANGGIGYWDNDWKISTWDGTFDENGELVISIDLPENIDEVQVQSYWSQVWDNTVKDMVDTDVDLVKVILYYDDIEGSSTTTSAITTTKTTTVTTKSTTATTKATTSTTKATTVTTKATTTATTVSTSTSQVEVTLFGDVDLDGDVKINDAARIMAYVSNSEKYPLGAQALANADVYQRGDGISNMDALAVQKRIAQLILSLPESIL